MFVLRTVPHFIRIIPAQVHSFNVSELIAADAGASIEAKENTVYKVKKYKEVTQSL